MHGIILVQQFITPIIVCKKGKGINKKMISFYTLPEYSKWKENNQWKKLEYKIL